MRGAPFRVILSLAIDLNNQSQATDEALILIRALQAVPDVPDGVNGIKANDVDELRDIVRRLWDNQINTAKAIGDVGRLASVLRG